jgi:hypothetical protein
MRGKILGGYAVWRWLAVPVAAAILGLAACDRLLNIVDPQFPSDGEQFSPPAVYTTWWNMTQACSGSAGYFGDVTWYRTSEVLHDVRTGDEIGGYWSSFGNRIVLSRALVLEGGVVRHEMLHALLKGGGHPRNQFLGKCAGTVLCPEGCVRDAGPYPPPPESPIEVGRDSIDIGVDIEPGNPDSAHDGGFFSITVMVRNRSTHWITVPSYLTTIFPDYEYTHTFEFDVRGPSGGISNWEDAYDPSDQIFAPGETKKQVFDFTIGNDLIAQKLPPGNYMARGGYSDYWSTYSSFVIGP